MTTRPLHLSIDSPASYTLREEPAGLDPPPKLANSNVSPTGADLMQDHKDTKEALQQLARENARLRGEILATGVILAQLLQSICRTQLSPHAFATRIMKDASDAVQAFKPSGDIEDAAVMRKSALETVQHYEEQIRSVLPI